MPELIQAPSRFQSEQIQGALEAALERAVEHLDDMREREGDALAVELSRRLDAARRLHAKISERSLSLVDAYRARLRDRLERLLNDSSVAVEPGRMEVEIAILADKSDITEELVRLNSHFDQFEKLLQSNDTMGRRLDFLLQEVGREVNTIGSKSQDAPLSHVVVEMKAEIERMREQVQNVE
jgi:uncharacterized protein (TIGR00255 family)